MAVCGMCVVKFRRTTELRHRAMQFVNVLLILALHTAIQKGDCRELHAFQQRTALAKEENGKNDSIDGDTAIAHNELVRSVQPYVFGGRGTFRGRFPYMVSVTDFFGQHKCGGILIHPQWVLSAAHCLAFVGDNPRLFVGPFLLTDDARQGVEMFRPSKIIPHSNWTGQPIDGFDIALFKLPKRSNHPPARLAKNSTVLNTDQPLSVLGWGRNGLVSPVQNTLQIADHLQHVELEDCLLRDEWSITTSGVGMCAVGAGQNTCPGDSGGPLLAQGVDSHPENDIIWGITSFGHVDCTLTIYPTFYTRVDYFEDWIAAQLGPEWDHKLQNSAESTHHSNALHRGVIDAAISEHSDSVDVLSNGVMNNICVTPWVLVIYVVLLATRFLDI